MIVRQAAFAAVLRNKFLQAKLKNPSFSVRALSRKIGTSPSTVSEVLNGKRGVSEKKALKILERLTKDARELDRSKKSVFRARNSEIGARQPAIKLTVESFAAIAEWHHFAILSLAETVDFRSDPFWIAERLNISSTKARRALNTLAKLSLLKRDERGQWQCTGVRLSTTEDIANAAIRNSHLENLQLQQAALERVPVDEREFTSIMIAVDPSKLPEAKRRIRAFRQSLSDLLEGDRKSEVFRLCIQLFPLSRSRGPMFNRVPDRGSER